MADSRERIYYTKAQITNGLKTGGGEWMYTDGTEYIGQYHRYSTGEVFTDSNYVNGKSRKLIPFVDLEKKLEDNEFGIDFSKNFEYDAIKSVDVQKSVKSNEPVSDIYNRPVKNGYIKRLFAYKVNDGQILELDEIGYGSVGSETGLDAILWRKFSIDWKVQGPDYDILDSQGNVKEGGIIDENRRTIEKYSEEYPTLSKRITDFRQFSKA